MTPRPFIRDDVVWWGILPVEEWKVLHVRKNGELVILRTGTDEIRVVDCDRDFVHHMTDDDQEKIKAQSTVVKAGWKRHAQEKAEEA